MTIIEPPVTGRKPSLLMNPFPIYWTMTIWTVLLGIVLIIAPRDWFGPSWSYFQQLPHNGTGMGLCCLGLGSLQLLALIRKSRKNILAIVFFLVGFVYWCSGIILGAEGLMGGRGLMEVPFMLYLGAHNFAHSASLMAYYRKSKKPEQDQK